MRLLLAEDERMMSDALVAILTHEHYIVDPVYDGEEALEYLRMYEYDCAILDLMMPKRDGLSVLRELRKSGSSMPVLILTAKSEIDDRVAGLDAGADDYLTKPFAMKELLARLRAMLRRKPEYTGDEISFADLTLCQADSTISGPDGQARLSGKEYRMLEMMMRNPKQVISTELFFEHVWGPESDSDTGVVWVNLSAIRRKVAQTGAHVQIKAQRGVGYYLAQSGEADA